MMSFFRRYRCWVDPRRVPVGAEPESDEAAKALRDVANEMRGKWDELGQADRRWLVWRGPSARRSLLVRIDAPKHEPRWFYASEVVEHHRPKGWPLW